MKVSPLIYAAIALGPPWALSCVTITHADEYAVVQPPEDDRLCARCPQRPDLIHPPCPPEGVTTPGDQVVFFAMKSLDLGTKASTWSAGYHVGLDQDCSSRPGGKPVMCTQRNPLTVFERLANGVDNALATQVLYPLLQLEEIDPQEFINQSLELGYGGVLLIVDAWNGLPDDDQVNVRLVPAMTTATGPPAWDGTDRWIAYADRYDPSLPGRNVPDTDNKTDTAYVTKGTLVWDARSLPAFLMPFGAQGALVQVRLADVVVMGTLQPDQRPRLLTDAALAGVWSAFLASRNSRHLAEVIARCDTCEVERLTPIVEELLGEAPDMLLPASEGASRCDAISVGFLGSYVEIEAVADLLPVSSLPNSCADASPCVPED